MLKGIVLINNPPYFFERGGIMLTHYTRKRLEEEKQAKQPAQEEPKEQPAQEQMEFEFAEESTPQMELSEDFEQKSKRKKKGE